DLRQQLQQRLPEYMVPSSFVVLDALPLTPNGKLDRQALPVPSVEEDLAYVAPRTKTEQALAALWSELLGVERVGLHGGFFALGGPSLLAMQLISRVRDVLHVDLPVRTLWDSSSLDRLAGEIVSLNASPKSDVPIKRVNRAAYRLSG